MDHDYIRYLREHNPTIKLLKLDNAPLIISFLYRIFKQQSRNTLPENEVTNLLSDYLYSLNQDDTQYAQTAQDYLKKWANDGYLRKWYEDNNDEAMFELTPGTEKALEWIKDLDKKEFIGTESRLLAVFSTLKEIVYKNSYDPLKRIEEIERQKLELDNELAKIRAGELERLDPTQIKERFINAEETGRKLLADFRQIEQNFRELDHEVRKKQINSNFSKGKILDDIFKVQDVIWETDQGKSFRAFWEFLMSQNKQDELNELIEAVLALPEIQDFRQENLIERLKISLIEAGDKVNKTNYSIIEQLRKFLDSQLYLENKRILDIIKSIEAGAINLKDKIPAGKDFFQIDDRIKLDFVMERPLFNPPSSPKISNIKVTDGQALIDASVLYQQLYINPEELRAKIRELLKTRTQVTLKEITDIYPVEKGLAELIAYFNLAEKDNKAIINEQLTEQIIITNNDTNRYLTVKLPQTIFCK